jgi:hypothetical protein
MSNRSAPPRFYSAVKAFSIAAGVVGALAVGSCHSAPLTRPESAVPKSITLERTACFGMCPAYQLTVNSSGTVSFVSRNPRDTARTATDRVAPSVLDSLYARAVRIGFFALPDTLIGDPTYCAHRPTDQASAIVKITTDTDAKSVVDYHGCTADSPTASETLRQLRLFEAAIDSLTGASRWIQPNRR